MSTSNRYAPRVISLFRKTFLFGWPVLDFQVMVFRWAVGWGGGRSSLYDLCLEAPIEAPGVGGFVGWAGHRGVWALRASLEEFAPRSISRKNIHYSAPLLRGLVVHLGRGSPLCRAGPVPPASCTVGCRLPLAHFARWPFLPPWHSLLWPLSLGGPQLTPWPVFGAWPPLRCLGLSGYRPGPHCSAPPSVAPGPIKLLLELLEVPWCVPCFALKNWPLPDRLLPLIR
nr:hypothetical protein Iba_chr01dCG6750 [Ipomoea batatas]